MQDISVTLLQRELHWENKEANLKMFSDELRAMREDVGDIVVLPEMFSTGFSMKPEEFGESMEGAGVQWMKDIASEIDSVVTGSLIIKENGKYFNRMVWMRPDGSMDYYDKRHLFRMADEHHHYAQGNERMIVNLNGWRINLQVCYDLRFPVWSRNREDHDAVIYVANWPEPRRDAWMTLLKARAIENQVYVIGVNRVGDDGNGIPHSGDSGVYDPKGQLISTIPSASVATETVSLSWDELERFREKFPVGMDADKFTVDL